MNTEQPILTIRSLYAGYGNANILNGASLALENGGVLCLGGVNGSGKSTLLKAIAGLVRSSAGSVVLASSDITSQSTATRLKMGIGYLPQEQTVFGNLTVEENLRVASGSKKIPPSVLSHVEDLFPGRFKFDQKGALLSGGERRLLGFAMLLARGPQKIWLLDEPSAGVSPDVIERIYRFLARINQENGISLLIVEQNLNPALAICSQAAWLKAGQIEKSKAVTPETNRAELIDYLLT